MAGLSVLCGRFVSFVCYGLYAALGRYGLFVSLGLLALIALFGWMVFRIREQQIMMQQEK